MMPIREQEAPLSLTSRVTQALCDCRRSLSIGWHLSKSICILNLKFKWIASKGMTINVLRSYQKIYTVYNRINFKNHIRSRKMTPLSWITISIWHQLYPKVATSYCFKTREFCSIIAIVQSCVEQLIERCGYELYRVKKFGVMLSRYNTCDGRFGQMDRHTLPQQSPCTLCKRDMR